MAVWPRCKANTLYVACMCVTFSVLPPLGLNLTKVIPLDLSVSNSNWTEWSIAQEEIGCITSNQSCLRMQT